MFFNESDGVIDRTIILNFSDKGSFPSSPEWIIIFLYLAFGGGDSWPYVDDISFLSLKIGLRPWLISSKLVT